MITFAREKAKLGVFSVTGSQYVYLENVNNEQTCTSMPSILKDNSALVPFGVARREKKKKNRYEAHDSFGRFSFCLTSKKHILYAEFLAKFFL